MSETASEEILLRKFTLKRYVKDKKPIYKTSELHLPPSVLKRFGFDPNGKVFVRIQPGEIVITPAS